MTPKFLKLGGAAAVFSVAIALASTFIPMTGASAQSTQSTDNASGAGVAIFAGGCFWCVESDFDHVPGVTDTLSGYTGGTTPNPTYQQVSGKSTGHREAVQIQFDDGIVSYRSMVETFLRTIDAVDNGGQFCDRGFVYSPAIYAVNDDQARIANEVIASVNASGKLPQAITLPVMDATEFYEAEDFHQDYYARNPIRYRFYRASCGRDRRVNQLWGNEARKGLAK